MRSLACHRLCQQEAPHAPTGALNRDDRSRLFSLLLAPNKGTLYSKERIVQVASVCLLIGYDAVKQPPCVAASVSKLPSS